MKHLKDIVTESFFDDDIDDKIGLEFVTTGLRSDTKDGVVRAVEYLYKYIQSHKCKRLIHHSEVKPNTCYIAFDYGFEKTCKIDIFTLNDDGEVHFYYTRDVSRGVSYKFMAGNWKKEPYFRSISFRSGEVYELTGVLAELYDYLTINRPNSHRRRVSESFFDDDIDDKISLEVVTAGLRSDDKDGILQAVEYLYKYVQDNKCQRITTKSKIKLNTCYIVFDRDFETTGKIDIFTLEEDEYVWYFYTKGVQRGTKLYMGNWYKDSYFRPISFRSNEVYELTGVMSELYDYLYTSKVSSYRRRVAESFFDDEDETIDTALVSGIMSKIANSSGDDFVSEIKELKQMLDEEIGTNYRKAWSDSRHSRKKKYVYINSRFNQLWVNENYSTAKGIELNHWNKTPEVLWYNGAFYALSMADNDPYIYELNDKWSVIVDVIRNAKNIKDI